MRRKMLVKATSVCLAVMMATSLFAGCGNKKKNDNTSTSATNVKADKKSGTTKLSYAMASSPAWKDRYKSYDQLPMGKELEKRTGVDLDMVHVEDANGMNLLIAGGDLPDIIGYNWREKYSGGEAKAISDGVVYGMSEDFVKKNAPDYWKVLNANPDIMKQVKTAKGDIYGFAFILGDELLKGCYGLIVRDDWCKELGIDTPQTADEFYNMLKLFKDKKNATVPFCVGTSGITYMLDRGIITSSFNLPTRDVYVDGDKVKIGYAQKEYKDVLTWLHKLYKEGLIDPNFASTDESVVASNMLTGKSGATADGSVIGTWIDTNKGEKNYSLAGIRNLVSKAGDKPMYGQYNNDVVGVTTAITASCKDKKAAAKFLNYGYSEEGNMLYNYGIEGKSYTMVDGKPTFTDQMLNNPDGLTPQQALSEYEMAYTNGPFVQDKDYLLQYYKMDEQKEALKQWTDNDAKKYKLPNITIASKDLGEYSSLLSDITTYRDEMMIKFIQGTESLDNFDSYLDTLDSMGINQLKKIIQNAVDEYNNR